jgi:hypothetical protein
MAGTWSREQPSDGEQNLISEQHTKAQIRLFKRFEVAAAMCNCGQEARIAQGGVSFIGVTVGTGNLSIKQGKAGSSQFLLQSHIQKRKRTQTHTMQTLKSHRVSSSSSSKVGAPRSRSAFRVYAVNYDPENLFKGSAPKEGLIERRMMSKQMQTDKQFAAMVTAAQDEDRKKLLLRRQSRTPPTDHIELIEFFLNTQADDMEVWLSAVEALLCPAGHCTSSLEAAVWTVPQAGFSLFFLSFTPYCGVTGGVALPAPAPPPPAAAVSMLPVSAVVCQCCSSDEVCEGCQQLGVPELLASPCSPTPLL